jgi:membrane-bound lytic murein transglycosylase B
MIGMPAAQGMAGRTFQVPAGSYIDAAGNIVKAPAVPIATTAPSAVPTIDASWLANTSSATRIAPRTLTGYARAAVETGVTDPACHVSWNMIAAIGLVESANGTHDGALIGDDGELVGEIIGPALDGAGGTVALPDTDDGRLDHDTTWDHAVGPMQFVPSTWALYAADGNGDGVADPNQIDDAALATAHLLCAGSRDLKTAAGWHAAMHAYNDLDSYDDAVSHQADLYAQEAR